MKSEHASGLGSAITGAAAGTVIRSGSADEVSDKARRNVKLVLVELLTVQDMEVMEALSKVAPVFQPVLPDIKTEILSLLEKDPDVREAVQRLAPKPYEPRLGESDAEHAQNVVTLIEEKLRQHIRPDAIRKPLP